MTIADFAKTVGLAFLASAVVFVLVGIGSAVIALSDDIQTGAISSFFYFLFLGALAVITAPLWFVFMMIVVPLVAVFPVAAILTTIGPARSGRLNKRPLFALWLSVWLASMYLALSTGLISA